MRSATRSSPSTRPARPASSRRTVRRPGAGLASIVAAGLVGGCAAGLPADDAADRITAADLVHAAPLTAIAGDPAPLPDADLLGLDPAMEQFLAARVDPHLAQAARLQQLIDAVMGPHGAGIEYDGRTLTAAQAFHERQANCLSFTSLFVALARRAGIPATFQEVDIPPDWSRMGDSLVLNLHVNALVGSTRGDARIVDFNMEDFRAGYDRRPVSDGRALAHYYNNLGVERAQSGATGAALAHIRKSLAQDPGFAPAWVNLGVLYLRAGQADWARAAWRQALRVQPRQRVALSNLERSYRQDGRIAEADTLARRVESYRLANPYYRYFLAQQAYARRDYGEAIRQLEVAVRNKRDEDQFYALLGLAYLGQGDTRAAHRWLARAEAVAADGAARDRYHGKLELLERASRG